MPKRDHPEPPSKMEVSRRGFLKGAGAVLSSGIVAGAEALEAARHRKCQGHRTRQSAGYPEDQRRQQGPERRATIDAPGRVCATNWNSRAPNGCVTARPVVRAP